MDSTDKNSPAFRCQAARAMTGPIEIIRDVRAGTLQLRAKSRTYLPNEPAEKSEQYDIRRSRAIFFNALERTLHSLVGLVFRKEIEFEDDVPVEIQGTEATSEAEETAGWIEDIDQKGTHLDVFAKEFFADVMAEGHGILFVDMPPQLPVDATRTDEIAANRRPYFRKYLADQAINWRLDRSEKLAQITFCEKAYEPDGEFGEAEVTRYRVMRRGEWILYREMEGKAGKEIIEEARGTFSDPQGNPLPEIPVAVAYSRKCAELESRPPLLDLALINVAHFQKYSDYSIYLHICSRPILWFQGRDKSKKVEHIGPYSFFDAENVAFAETTGAALGAAREDMTDLKEMMAVLGLSILAQKTPNQTATETMIDSVQEESDLATAARSLKDCIEAGLGFMAQYMGLPTGGSIRLGASAQDLTLAPDQMRAFIETAGRIFSTDTVRQVIVNTMAELFPDDYSEATEAAKLAAEKTEASQFAANLGAQSLAQFDRGMGGVA